MDQRSLRWRIPLVALIVAGCMLVAYPPFDPDGDGPEKGKLKLGLDLQGGMHLVLRVLTEELPENQRDDATDRALEIIRNRIDQFGVAEPSIQRQGQDEIVVQLPGVTDRERALDLIGKTALLEFKLVARPGEKEGEGRTLYKQKDGKGGLKNPDILLEDETLLKGENLTDASVQYSSDWNEPVVTITLDSKGAKTFGDITSKYCSMPDRAGRQLAILLDSVVQSAPVLREPILSGEAQISGNFSLKEASDLSITLRAGALPAPIRIEEERSVGPTLGRDSVTQGIRATLWAGLVVVIFMAVYYLIAGLVADAVLCLNIVIIAACLSYFHATLTVPGIAGIILTIGMAVDLNVLILERIREEMRSGKRIQAAIATGYRRAFSAILDSNLTTLITAFILFRFGTGPIRGFALTLGVGIVASFITGLFVTRVVYDYFWGVRGFQSLPMLSFMKQSPKISFMKPRAFFIAGSVLMVLGSFAVMSQGMERSLGIDFTGGVLYEYRFEKPIHTEAIRESIKEIGLETAIIQKFGDDREIVVRTGMGTEEGVLGANLTGNFQDNPHELMRIEQVGPVIGRQLRKKSLFAVLFSLLSILVYLAYRFELRYAAAAIIALFHDAVICLGALVLTGRELSIPVLAAILTVVGYSVNDTIVTFDRIREDLKKRKKEPYVETVNQAVNETLSRTILTSMTTLLVVVCLYLFGGAVINDFAFTMIIGILSGTYSSIYVACPVIISWRLGKKKNA